MNQLSIKLTGALLSSNFDEWKNGLITQIHSTNTELISNEDFVEAARHVKLFKQAEKSLQVAKRDALQQVADIQALFDAIDKVTQEAREARLSLDRQIRQRKAEIKEEVIQSGIDRVQKFIEQQGAEFLQLEHSAYVDRRRFEMAAKGKGAIMRLHGAINGLCDDIKLEVSQKVSSVVRNGATLDALPSQNHLLFQDRSSLLALSERELRLTIEKRMAVFEVERTRKKARNAVSDLKRLEELELNPDIGANLVVGEAFATEKYKLTIEILSTKEVAIELARSINKNWGNEACVTSIQLARDRDG